MAWAPDYATEEELASYLRIDDTVDDVELALAISGASRGIDFDTNRQFGSVSAEERTYPVRYDYDRGVWVADTDDHFSAPTVTVDGTAVATFVSEPRNAPQNGRPWTRIVFTTDSEVTPDSCSEVAATAPWGWTPTWPDPIKQACLLQASRLFWRRNAPAGVAGSPEAGSEVRLLARIDPDVAVMLRPYRRHRAVG